MANHDSTQSKFIGVSRIAPYAVFIDGEKVAEYDNQTAAARHYNALAYPGAQSSTSSQGVA